MSTYTVQERERERERERVTLSVHSRPHELTDPKVADILCHNRFKIVTNIETIFLCDAGSKIDQLSSNCLYSMFLIEALII